MDKVQKSLARIEGQVRGISRMHEEGKKRLDVVQQVAAAREALGRVGRDLLQDEACACIVDAKEQQKFAKILKQLFKS
jgi:DNA-binding FrmR family transcriptional regulator